MQRLIAAMFAVALALGLVALPAAQQPAEAHQVVGKNTVKKPVKLSGRTLQGSAQWSTADPQAFSPNHIQRRRLKEARIEVRSKTRNKNGKWTWSTVAGSKKHEMWNRQSKGEMLRPRARCEKGRRYRTAAVSEVIAPDVWTVGGMSWHGSTLTHTKTTRSKTSTRC